MLSISRGKCSGMCVKMCEKARMLYTTWLDTPVTYTF